MREPGKIMDSKELRKKLVDGRIHDSAALTEKERQALEQDRELQTEMQLNLVIDTNRPQAPDPPEVGGQIDQALRRVESIQAGKQQAGLLWGRRRLAAAAVAVAVLLLVMTVSPWRLEVTPQGLSLIRKEAWASFNGYLLEYTLVTTEYFSGVAVDSSDHPLRQMQGRVADWAQRSAHKLQVDNPRDLAQLSVLQFEADQSAGVYRARIQVGIYAEDESLANDLATELAGIEGLDEPRIAAQQWLANVKYPGRYFAARDVTITASVPSDNHVAVALKKYSYPVDINEMSIPALTTILQPFDGDRMYIALDGYGEMPRYNLAGLFSVRHLEDRTVELSSIAPDFDFASLGLPPWVHAFAMSIPRGGDKYVVDPAMMITKLAQDRDNAEYAACLPGNGHLIEVDLLPGRSHKTADSADYIAAKSNSEQVQVACRQFHANSTFVAEDSPGLAIYTVDPGGFPVRWFAQTSFPGDEYVVHELSSTLMSHGVPSTAVIPLSARLPDNAGKSAPAMSLAYYFFDLQRFAGLHQSGVRREFSEAEFEHGRSLSRSIEGALLAFKAESGITTRNPDALPGLRELVYNGLVTGALVQTDYPSGPQLAELQATLADTGVPRAVVVAGAAVEAKLNRDDELAAVQRLSGLAPVLIYHLSFEERCQVCLDTDFPRIFTVAEREGSLKMLSDIRDQVEQWAAGQEPGTSAFVVETVAGGTVVRVTVHCSRTDDETVAAMAGAVDIADPPTSYYLEKVPQA